MKAFLGDDFFAGVFSITISDAPVSEPTLALIATLPDLKWLSITSGQVSERGLENLAKRSKLEHLTVRTTDAGLAHLTGLKTLTALTVAGTQMSDSGLETIAKIKHLEWLELNVKKVDIDGLAHLAKLPHLRHLYFNGMNTNDARLVKLELKSLKLLEMHQYEVTNAGVDRLRNGLPICRVGFSGPEGSVVDESVPEVK